MLFLQDIKKIYKNVEVRNGGNGKVKQRVKAEETNDRRVN